MFAAAILVAGVGGLACSSREKPSPGLREPPELPRRRTETTAPEPGKAPAAKAPERKPVAKVATPAEPRPAAKVAEPVAKVAKPRPPRNPDPLRVLIFTGRSNHNWRKTTPVLKRMYEENKRFVVDLTSDPAGPDAATFGRYDVLVSNWSAFPKLNERGWGPGGEKAFLDFVRGGKGFVLFHAASATFHSWPEFQDLIGATWGKGTGHGPNHTFKVTIADKGHPVTRGMSDFWTTDELWHRMATRPTMKVLCTAFSDKGQRGSGKHEPVVIHTRLGKGRCFHLVLGHDTKAMRNVGWRTLMLRGTEWAATGSVTLPVLAGLPTTRAAAAVVNVDVDAALAAIKSYKITGSRKVLLPVERLVHHAATDSLMRKELAAKLAALLDSDATTDCKRFVCRQLSLIGSGPEVPALAALVGNKDLSLAARSALERIPGKEALSAMRSALGTAEGPVLVGLMNTLGERRDAAAVGAIAKHLIRGDVLAAGAAVDALGKIGGVASARALAAAEGKLSAKPSGKLAPAFADALLRCADGMLAAGNTREAAVIYKDMSSAKRPKHVRVAAFPGLVACQKDGAAELILKALTGKDREMQLAAVRGVRSAGGEDLTRSLAGLLGDLPPPVRAGVIQALAERGDAAALPAVAAQAASGDTTVRRAALVALGRLGNASTVELLAALAARADSAERQIARKSLARLRGGDIEAAMARLLKGPEAGVRREIVSALAARGARSAVGALIEAAGDADRAVRKEAVKAVGALADVSACPRLIALLPSRESASERREIENALVSICRRGGEAGGGAGPVLAGLGRATVTVRLSLLRVLGKVGGEKALAAVRAALADRSPEVRTAAVRALADWPDTSVLPELLSAARSAGTDTVRRVLALRAFAQLASKAEDRSAEELVRLYTEAAALARGATEKKALFGGLGRVAHPGAMKLALGGLGEAALADEAGLAVVQIAGVLWKSDREAVRSALGRVLAAAKAGEVRQKATEIMLRLDKPVNLAIGATATSPDGLGKDGGAGGDGAAIDGDPGTYWDEVDGRKLYRLVVTFKRPTEVSALAITGFQHHSYAPRDFDVICDGKVVRAVRGAVYDNNKLSVAFPATRARSLELKITRYYGQSPAIRELEIYNLARPDRAAPKGTTVPTNPGYAWRRTDTSLALVGRGGVVWQLNYKKEEGKPYFHPLGLTDGTVLTWLRPADHVWHRALWFSWKYLNGLNYWEEDRRTGLSQGRTEIVGVKVTARKAPSARIEMDLSYHPPGKPAIMTEKCLLEVGAPDKTGNYRIDWRSVFTAGGADVKLDRTPIKGERGGKGWGGYAGLSLRMAKSTRGWHFVDSEGRRDAAGHGQKARWMDFSGSTAKGTSSGVAVFDHPDNLRHPQPWYVAKGMPYFSPALLFKKPYTLAAGKSLMLRYRILVHAGGADGDYLQKEWKAFSILKD